MKKNNRKLDFTIIVHLFHLFEQSIPIMVQRKLDHFLWDRAIDTGNLPPCPSSHKHQQENLNILWETWTNSLDAVQCHHDKLYNMGCAHVVRMRTPAKHPTSITIIHIERWNSNVIRVQCSTHNLFSPIITETRNALDVILRQQVRKIHH
jgi:hypothetical protein